MMILLEGPVNKTDKEVVRSVGITEPTTLYMTSTKRHHQTSPIPRVNPVYVTLCNLCNDAEQTKIFTEKLREINSCKLQFIYGQLIIATKEKTT